MLKEGIILNLIAGIQVHLVSFSILITIYARLRKEAQAYSLQDRLFKYLTLSTMLPLILEAITRLIDGQPGQIASSLNMGSNILLFMVNIIQLVIWTLYIITTISQDKKNLIKICIPMGIVLVINMLIALSTPISKKYFYIDAHNIYHRGDWYIVSIGMAGLLFLYNIYIIIINWKKINQRNRIPMLSFLLPSIVGMILQTMFYGISLIWAGGAISILMIYITVQSQVANTDYLTGLYNRRYLDNYLDQSIKNMPPDKKIGGIMVDVDDFKSINDRHGHATGDMALRTASTILKKVFDKDEVVARYGGDEFVVLLNIKEEKELHQQVNNLKKQFDLFNNKKKEVFELKVSIGYDIYTFQDDQEESFLYRLDQLMYGNKSRKKTF